MARRDAFGRSSYWIVTSPIETEMSESVEGYSEFDGDIGSFVCGRCIGDGELRAFIRANAVSKECSFCGRRSMAKLIAADANSIASLVEAYVLDEYEDAAEHVPYESAEGGYQARTMTTDELLTEEVGLWCENEKVLEFIIDTLPDYAWVQRDFFSLSPYDELKYGWDGFADAVKHKTRYLFFPPRKGDDDWPNEGIRPEAMLRELGGVLRLVHAVRKLKAGTLLYRIRVHKATEQPTSLEDLGPPPSDAAIYANRMSPAGISMLYAAEDEATAVAEIASASTGRTDATLATFRLLEDFKIVDLVRLRPIRLFTEDLSRRERAQLRFAHAFAREVSKKVAKDGREHIEYVPTQIVTEYLRFRFRYGRQPVRGLRYRSSQEQNGVNVALFVGHDDITPPRWSQVKSPIELVELRRITVA